MAEKDKQRYLTEKSTYENGSEKIPTSPNAEIESVDADDAEEFKEE